MSAPTLEARALGMTFPGEVHALRDVSLTVEDGEFVVILGPSGAGKSTLLRSFNRLVRPTSGAILFRGEDVTRASGARLRRLRRRVGMIFQQFNLVGRLTVLDNVLAGRLCSAGKPFGYVGSHVRVFSSSEREQAFEALCQVGVGEKAFQRASDLSGGQQQRVAIARVLAQRPEVLLADEPIASLDPRSATIVMDLLRDIRETRGMPVVVNLHQVDVAKRYATRIVGMREGRVVFDGSPGDLDPVMERALYDGDESETDVPVIRKEQACVS